MIVNFTKMHGLGNDFVVIDLITQGARLQKSHIRRISDRRFGIGCDQVITVNPPTKPDVDFFYRIYNADGHEAEQCVNGLRCAAKFFIDGGFTNKNQLVADCLGGTAKVKLDNEQLVSLELQANHNAIESINFDYPNLPTQLHSISVGNPHAVCIVDNLNITPVREWGAKFSKDHIFPNGANIGFMQIVDRANINLRVYERGSGPTLACGSGALAAVLVGRSLNLLDNLITVKFEAGELVVSYDTATQTLGMTGPAISVFIGRFKI